MTPLDDTLTTALATKAAQVEVTVGEFDPTRRGPLADSDAGTHPSPRRLLPAAAIVLVVALVVGASLALRRGDDTLTTGGGEEGWLVPGWVPEGMDLWSAGWSGPSAPEEAGDDSWNTFQLFGDPDAGRALYVQTLPQYQESTASSEPVTVRGGDGWVGPSVDLPQPVDWVVWYENGATITAQFKGMTSAEALAAVEQLEWRSDSPADGFAAEGSLDLSGESLRREYGRSAQFHYSQGPPTEDPDEGRPAIVVSTSTGGGMSIGYLDTWFYEGGAAESDGSRHAYGRRDLGVFWPDGRQAQVFSMAAGAPLDRATMERIVASLVVEDDEADLAPLSDAAAANVAALPLLASTEVGVGTLELRGDGGFHRLCLRRPGTPTLDCGDTPGLIGVGSPTATETVVLGAWEIDGTWFVAAAASGFETRIDGGRGEGIEDDVLPATAATVGHWQLLFVQPPYDVERVYVTEPGGATGAVRPR